MISLPKGVNLNQLIQFLRNIGLQSSALLRDFENQSTSLYDSLENLSAIRAIYISFPVTFSPVIPLNIDAALSMPSEKGPYSLSFSSDL